MLCTGPSLVDFYNCRSGDYETVYAINDAKYVFPCDIWVSWDAGLPNARARDWAVDLDKARLIEHCPELEGKRGLFTLPALCYYLRSVHSAQRVDFYGLDMTDRAGLSGIAPTSRRWEGELRQLRKAWDFEHFSICGLLDVERLRAVVV